MRISVVTLLIALSVPEAARAHHRGAILYGGVENLITVDRVTPTYYQSEVLRPALATLGLSESEAADLRPVVEELVRLRLREEKRHREFQILVEAPGDQDLAAALESFRAARAIDREAIRAAESRLRKLLSPEQEARLVAVYILQ